MANLNPPIILNVFKLHILSKSNAVFYLILLSLTLFSRSLFADTNFPLLNSAYKYNPNAPVKCKYYLAAEEDSIHIYLKITVNGDLQDYKVGYVLKNDYGEKNLETVDSIQAEKFLIGSKKNSHYLKLPLKVNSDVNLLLLHITKADQPNYYFDIPLDLDDRFSPPNLVALERNSDLPIFESFIKEGQAYNIQQSFRSSDSIPLHFYRYKHEFSAAYPPMSSGADPGKSLEIDSTFTLNSDNLTPLEENALYFVQSDSTTLKGLSFRIVPSYYPDFKRAEELINPLIYISTKNEMTRLSRASDIKKALDKYWLDLIGNPGRARNTIKSFYDQVEMANAIFTTYKEGWKTDQGMIFTLYGPPDEVYFDGKEEQWLYKKNNDISRVKFTFVKIKNIFTNQHFELMRNKSYESFWFGNVELWRKGIKNL